MKSISTIQKIVLPLLVITLSACGSSNENVEPQKVSGQSSSNQTSSSTSANFGAVNFVYPTQHAYVGSNQSLKLTIDVKDLDNQFDQFKVLETNFVSKGNLLETESPIQIESGHQHYPLEIFGLSNITNDWVVVDVLDVNTKLNQFPLEAGNTRVYSVRGVALNQKNNDVYYTNPYDAQLLKLDLSTGESEIIYQGEQQSLITEALYWPVAIDSENDNLYVSADRASWTQNNEAKYSVSLVTILDVSNTAMTVVYPDTNERVTSTHSLVLDVDKKLLSSSVQGQQYATAYSLNNGSQPIMRWYVEGPQLGKPNPLNPTQDSNANFLPEFGLVGLSAAPNFDGGRMIGLREYSTIEFRGKPALIEIDVEDDGFGGFVSTARHMSDIEGLVKPTCLLHDNQSDSVFIADSDRIWKIDLNTFAKQLISSSNTLSQGLKGNGPSLGGKISAMAQHSDGEYLYIAADNGGLMMIDLETGDRITVAK